MNYTIIAYKSDGSNSCRGQTYDQWGSQFEIRYTADRREVVKYMAGFLADNLRTEQGEWDISVMYNGIPRDEYDRGNLYYRFLNRAEKIAKVMHQEYITKQDAARAAREEAARQQKVQQDLATLNRLKAQYGETP